MGILEHIKSLIYRVDLSVNGPLQISLVIVSVSVNVPSLGKALKPCSHVTQFRPLPTFPPIFYVLDNKSFGASVQMCPLSIYPDKSINWKEID